jgi:hypothetical protein
MGGTISTMAMRSIGEPPKPQCETSYFFENVDNGSKVELVAVVIQRFTDHRDAETALKDFEAAKAAMERELDAFRAMMSKDPSEWPADRGPPFSTEWSSTSSTGKPTEVGYSRQRKLVRVGGEDFPLPDSGQTLVVLFDHDAPLDSGRRSRLAHLDVPLRQRDRPDPGTDRKQGAKEHGSWIREAQGEWQRLVCDLPAVRAFLAETG